MADECKYRDGHGFCRHKKHKEQGRSAMKCIEKGCSYSSIVKSKMGKTSRAQGAEFENRVRLDLEEKGWIVDKWSNNVDLEYHSGGHYVQGEFISKGKLVKAKNKWAGPGRPMTQGAGFPDFIAFSIEKDIDIRKSQIKYLGDSMRYIPYEVIGVESKVNGYLDKAEREKCKWLLDNNIFSKILIARKTKVKNKIVVEYKEFK